MNRAMSNKSNSIIYYVTVSLISSHFPLTLSSLTVLNADEIKRSTQPRVELAEFIKHAKRCHN